MNFWDSVVERFGDNLETVLIPGAPLLMNKIVQALQKRTLTNLFSSVRFIVAAEMGVGVGRWIPSYALKDKYAVGIDISRGMLKIAKHRVVRAKLRNVDLILASVEAIPLRSNIVDLSLSITCIQHVIDETKHRCALSEILRCTKGVAIFLESKSMKKTLILNHYYPTLLLPIEEYIKIFNELKGRVVKLCGVDFLPFFWWLEKIRDFFYARVPNLKIPIYGGSFAASFIRSIYYIFACFLIVSSSPFVFLFGENLVLSRHFLAIVKKLC